MEEKESDVKCRSGHMASNEWKRVGWLGARTCRT